MFALPLPSCYGQHDDRPQSPAAVFAILLAHRRSRVRSSAKLFRGAGSVGAIPRAASNLRPTSALAAPASCTFHRLRPIPAGQQGEASSTLVVPHTPAMSVSLPIRRLAPRCTSPKHADLTNTTDNPSRPLLQPSPPHLPRAIAHHPPPDPPRLLRL